MTRTKNSIALLLALCLLFTTLPMAAATESGQYDIYGISLPLLTPDTAEADLLATGDCLLVVALYDANGKMLDLGKTAVTGSTERQTCTVTFSADRPEQVLAKAFLLDQITYTPLCSSDMLNETCIDETSYAINGLTVSGADITAIVTTSAACTLSVQILSEDSAQVLHSYSADAAEGLQMEAVVVSAVDAVFPTYFLLRAILVDSATGQELCNPYTTRQYTQAYLQFAAQTPEDEAFQDNIVLDFGVNGFGVLVDGAFELEGIASTEDYTTYTVTDSTAPAAGDVVLLTDAEGVQTPILVLSATDNGNGTVTIVRDPETGIGDLYQVLNLDATVDVGAAAQNGGEAAMLQSENADEDITLEAIKLEGALTASAITASGSVSVILSAKIYYDAKLLGSDYIEASTSTTIEGGITSTISGKVSSSDLKDAYGDPLIAKITLYKGMLIFPGTGLLTFFLDISVPLEFDIEASGTATFGISNVHGFSYNSNDGVQKIRKTNTIGTLDVKGSAVFKLGPKVTLEVFMPSDIFWAEISAYGGVKIQAVATHSIIDISTAEKIHGCDLCFDISRSSFTSANGKLNYKITKYIKGTMLSFDLLSASRPLDKAYWSIINDEDSLFNGEEHKDYGECPNYKYLITIVTENSNGETVSGLPVSVTTSVGEVMGSGASPYALYLYDCDYIAAATFEDGTYDTDFLVNRNTQTVTVCQEVTMVRGTVTDALSGAPLEGVRIETTLQGVTRSAVTNADGEYALTLAPGSFTLRFTKTDYSGTGRSIVLMSGLNNFLNVEMSPKYCTVRFDANGGSGVMDDQKEQFYSTYTFPECTFTPPEGMVFQTWEVNGTTYNPGSTYYLYMNTAVLTVKAIWTEATYPVTVKLSLPDGTPVQSALVLGLDSIYAYSTSEEGTVTKYLSVGDYTLLCWTDEYYATQKITVNSAMEVELTALERTFSWSFDEETGTLRVTGSGPMPDYGLNTTPWTDIQPKITHLDFSGLLTVGNWAFNNCHALIDASIPDGVVAIGNCAFIHCSSLQSVTIPDSVVWIGRGAASLGTFENCTSLSSLVLPESVEYIGDTTFKNSGLTSIIIPDSVSYLGNSAFLSCSDLATVVIRDGLTSLNSYTFEFCDSLTNVSLPNSITQLGLAAFGSCSALTNIDLPDNLSTIGQAAFEACKVLTHLEIPATVTSIGGSAFGSCSALSKVIFTSEAPPSAHGAAFGSTPATVYYPQTWESIPTMGSKLTFISYDPANGIPE